jgi:HSP20 family protein
MPKNWNWTKDDDQQDSRNISTSAPESRNLPAASSYFGPLSHFYHDMDRMFDQAFRNFGLPSVLAPMQGMLMPKIDISSTDKEYRIEVEVPGIQEEDIRLDVTRDGQLCICGEKRQENDRQEKDFHRTERSYGSFSRTLSLPDDVDQDNIQANFDSGVLTITIPRMESQTSQARRIEVGTGDRSRQRSRHESSRQETRQDNTASSNPKRAA